MYPPEYKENVPTRETEIHRVVSRLSEVAKDLEETVKAYHARLEGVVVGGLLDVDKEQAGKPEFGTKLGQELDNIHNKIHRAGKSLYDLLQRVEL